MAESKSEELETLVYCLGPVGGEENNVTTQGLAFTSKYHYTRKGYARYIEEAKNIIKFHHRVIDYFMDSVKSELEEDPLAFIDTENKEDLQASIHKMKKPWNEMFKEHQKELRKALKNPKEGKADDELSDESSSSSAKIRKLDPEASSGASTMTSMSESEYTSGSRTMTSMSESEYTSEASTMTSKSESEDTSEAGEKEDSLGAGAVGVPVDEIEFPQSIFVRRLKEFYAALKAEYLELKKRMGKALERFPSKETKDITKVQDLKGFVFLKMSTFAKWKYALKTLGHLVPELEKKFAELDLDFHKKKENEKRLTDWLFFDDGERDRKYYHRLLITMELTGQIEEISAIVCKQLRRYNSLTKSLKDKLPTEYDAFKEKVQAYQYEVLYHRPIKKAARPQKSNDSGDTLFNIDDMPDEI